MKHDRIIETRRALVRHNRGCAICAGGGGHPMWVLTIGYAGGRTRQFSLRGEQDFTRVGGAKMPDAKTIGRWGVALGPAVIKQIHERMMQIPCRCMTSNIPWKY